MLGGSERFDLLAACSLFKHQGRQVSQAMASPAAAGRGGERNFAKPEVDQEHLLDVLKKYVKHAGVGASFSFEPYGTLSRSSAVQAKGLSKASGLIEKSRRWRAP